MDHITVTATATIRAPAARLYPILADYRRHHPRIVPPEYFRKVEVLEGGVGAGTRTRVEMRVLGTTKRFEHVIREPEPGRVLEEAEPDGSSVTTFTVEPVAGGETARVSIQTRLAIRKGLQGMVERLITPRLLRRIYVKELARLAAYAAALGDT